MLKRVRKHKEKKGIKSDVGTFFVMVMSEKGQLGSGGIVWKTLWNQQTAPNAEFFCKMKRQRGKLHWLAEIEDSWAYSAPTKG